MECKEGRGGEGGGEWRGKTGQREGGAVEGARSGGGGWGVSMLRRVRRTEERGREGGAGGGGTIGYCVKGANLISSSSIVSPLLSEEGQKKRRAHFLVSVVGEISRGRPCFCLRGNEERVSV